MEFSNVDGQRRLAEAGLKGVCDLCGVDTIPKCGNIRIHHWAHRRGHQCDPWWENETEWHRKWKREFPEDCREVTVTSSGGERHRADVKTVSGRVLEFQHSPIKLNERLAREAFYEEMVWVIDGLRLERFLSSFNTQLCQARVLQNSPTKLSVPIGNCSVLKTWTDSTVGVYLDFGDQTIADRRFSYSKPTLWRLYPGNKEDHAEMAPVWRDDFIAAALNGSALNGIYAPDLKVTPKISKKLMRDPSKTDVKMGLLFKSPRLPKSNIEWKPSEHQRGETESYTDYALRIWGIEKN